MTARYYPPRTHPQVVDQPTSRTGTTSRRAATGRRTTTSATGRSTARSRWPTGSSAASAAREKMSITAADRRDGGRRHRRPPRHQGAPVGAGVLGQPRSPRMRHAVATLRAWVRAGGHRLDRDHNGSTSTPRRSDPRPLVAEVDAGRVQADDGRATVRAPGNARAADDDPNLDGGPGRRTRRAGTTTRRRTCGAARPAGARGASRIYCGGSRAARASGGSADPDCGHRWSAALGQDPAGFYKDQTCEDYEMPSPVVLRRRAAAPGRRHQPAADPLDQPPDFQQVVEEPEAGAALAGAHHPATRGSRPRRRARGSLREASGPARRIRAGATGPRRASR